ncbi:MAG: hypothetical protein RBT33_03275 [Candidatus Dojkabacteria bacterium]|jgi:hypothetical protein|nr:hypothetical protein [Candidatus Dojkabacteria bacterium]
MILKKLGLFFLTLLILSVSTVASYAQSPNFLFYPSNGTVKDSSKGFTVDILIDSAGEKISKARFAIKFDPTQIQVVNASKNNTLFDQWPEDESTIDNQRGMIMLTGFTQSGTTTPLYVTGSEPDVMGRVQFEVITESEDDVVLSFEFSGTDEMFKSVIMKDGSPPQNILTTISEPAVFSLTGFISPSTAIEPSHIGIVLGILLIAVGIFVRNIKDSTFTKKRGTVVLYE